MKSSITIISFLSVGAQLYTMDCAEQKLIPSPPVTRSTNEPYYFLGARNVFKNNEIENHRLREMKSKDSLVEAFVRANVMFRAADAKDGGYIFHRAFAEDDAGELASRIIPFAKEQKDNGVNQGTIGASLMYQWQKNDTGAYVLACTLSVADTELVNRIVQEEQENSY